jgi:hypothetical protein
VVGETGKSLPVVKTISYKNSTPYSLYFSLICFMSNKEFPLIFDHFSFYLCAILFFIFSCLLFMEVKRLKNRRDAESIYYATN